MTTATPATPTKVEPEGVTGVVVVEAAAAADEEEAFVAIVGPADASRCEAEGCDDSVGMRALLQRLAHAEVPHPSHKGRRRPPFGAVERERERERERL